MRIVSVGIEGAAVVETDPVCDSRGAFARLFCDIELAPLLGNRRILQINHSRTAAVGAVRGMHYQRPPDAELKMIRCLRGRVWDVVLDVRRNSPTFLRWHAEELTPTNLKMLIVPEGCAHGFQVLEPDAELLYLHTARYNPKSEGAIRYDEPRVAIEWPVPVTDLSIRDASHPHLSAQFTGI